MTTGCHAGRRARQAYRRLCTGWGQYKTTRKYRKKKMFINGCKILPKLTLSFRTQREAGGEAGTFLWSSNRALVQRYIYCTCKDTRTYKKKVLALVPSLSPSRCWIRQQHTRERGRGEKASRGPQEFIWTVQKRLHRRYKIAVSWIQ